MTSVCFLQPAGDHWLLKYLQQLRADQTLMLKSHIMTKEKLKSSALKNHNHRLSTSATSASNATGSAAQAQPGGARWREQPRPRAGPRVLPPAWAAAPPGDARRRLLPQAARQALSSIPPSLPLPACSIPPSCRRCALLPAGAGPPGIAPRTPRTPPRHEAAAGQGEAAAGECRTRAGRLLPAAPPRWGLRSHLGGGRAGKRPPRPYTRLEVGRMEAGGPGAGRSEAAGLASSALRCLPVVPPRGGARSSRCAGGASQGRVSRLGRGSGRRQVAAGPGARRSRAPRGRAAGKAAAGRSRRLYRGCVVSTAHSAGRQVGGFKDRAVGKYLCLFFLAFLFIIIYYYYYFKSSIFPKIKKKRKESLGGTCRALSVARSIRTHLAHRQWHGSVSSPPLF